jgi:hypothetical protein
MTKRSTRVPAPVFCGSYWPGHVVHWIPGLHAANDPDPDTEQGRIVRVEQDGIVVLEFDGVEVTLWNHEPERLQVAARRNEGRVQLQRRWSILSTASKDGRYFFSVADPAKAAVRPCPASPPVGDLVELLEEAGGFSVPLDSVDAALLSDPAPSVGTNDNVP